MKYLPWILISLAAIVAFVAVFITIRVSLPRKKKPVVPADKVGEILRTPAGYGYIKTDRRKSGG